MMARILWCFLLVVTATTLSERGVAGADDFRYLTGYVDSGHVGTHYQFSEYTPDLSLMQMDNTIESACASGFWILYDAENYSPSLTGYICVFKGVNSCGDFTSSCKNLASSVRYAGSPYGLNDNYYNLYERTHFAGLEIKGNTNASDLGYLDKEVSSLIVTGQSPWTFYNGLHYTGTSVCVYPDEHYTDNGIDLDCSQFDNMDMLGLHDNSIRSVARGCFSERVLGHPGGERRGQDATN